MANFSDIINASLDLVVPHARREPLNPMAYVRDINEWFVPAAQMALDQKCLDQIHTYQRIIKSNYLGEKIETTEIDSYHVRFMERPLRLLVI